MSEFEILEMVNHDGRLQSGHCCDGNPGGGGGGQWPVLSNIVGNSNSHRVGGGACKGGNVTCLPYWRICIAELPISPPGLQKASKHSSGSGNKKSFPSFSNVLSR